MKSLKGPDFPHPVAVETPPCRSAVSHSSLQAHRRPGGADWKKIASEKKNTHPTPSANLAALPLPDTSINLTGELYFKYPRLVCKVHGTSRINRFTCCYPIRKPVSFKSPPPVSLPPLLCLPYRVQSAFTPKTRCRQSTN